MNAIATVLIRYKVGDQEYGPYEHYEDIYLRGAFIYLFVCVPAAGCIFPAITRNRVGVLLTHSHREGGAVRAHGGE